MTSQLYRINKKVVITPNPTYELEWTDDLFDDMIGFRIKCMLIKIIH